MFEFPWTRVKGLLALLSVVLLGLCGSASEHGHSLVAVVCAMGASTALFVAGVLVGYTVMANSQEPT